MSSSTAVAGIPQRERPRGHDLVRVGEARHRVRRPERTPGDVGVELGEHQRPDLGPLALGVLGDQGPLPREDAPVRAGGALALQRVEVGLVVVVLRGEEAVGDARDALDRRLGERPDQQLRDLLGHRRDREAREAVAPSLVGLARTRPGAADQLDALGEQAGPVPDLPAERLELALPIALAHPEVEAPTGEQGNGGGVLSEPDRVVQRRHDEVRPDPHPAGPLADRRGERER